MRTLYVLTFLAVVGISGAVVGCSGLIVEDESMYLTGTEEYAVTVNGAPACTNPKKVLVCHIPPGNPANAHDICVGASAVAPHQAQHGDGLGSCGGGGSDDGSDDDGGETPDAGTPPPPPPSGDDAGIVL